MLVMSAVWTVRKSFFFIELLARLKLGIEIARSVLASCGHNSIHEVKLYPYLVYHTTLMCLLVVRLNHNIYGNNQTSLKGIIMHKKAPTI